MRLYDSQIRITIDHEPGQSVSFAVDPSETTSVGRLRIPEAGGRSDGEAGFELPGPPMHIRWGLSFARHDADGNRPGTPVPPSDEIAPVAMDLDPVARLGLCLVDDEAGNGAGEDPGVAALDAFVLAGKQVDIGEAGGRGCRRHGAKVAWP